MRLATYASRCIENEVLMHFRGSRKSAGDLSLSDSIDTDSDGNSLSLIDVLADEEDMSERVVQTDLCQHLSQLSGQTCSTSARPRSSAFATG